MSCCRFHGYRETVFPASTILCDTRLDPLHKALDRAAREEPVTGIGCLELATVDRDDRLGEQVQISAERHELPEGGADRRPLSLRKAAIVLKSGVSRPVSYIISTLRTVSCSRRRLDWIWLM